MHLFRFNKHRKPSRFNNNTNNNNNNSNQQTYRRDKMDGRVICSSFACGPPYMSKSRRLSLNDNSHPSTTIAKKTHIHITKTHIHTHKERENVPSTICISHFILRDRSSYFSTSPSYYSSSSTIYASRFLTI